MEEASASAHRSTPTRLCTTSPYVLIHRLKIPPISTEAEGTSPLATIALERSADKNPRFDHSEPGTSSRPDPPLTSTPERGHSPSTLNKSFQTDISELADTGDMADISNNFEGMQTATTNATGTEPMETAESGGLGGAGGNPPGAAELPVPWRR